MLRKSMQTLIFLVLSFFAMEFAVQAKSEVFPEGGRIFKKLIADPEEVNSGGLFSRKKGLNVLDFSIGNHFGLQSWQLGKTNNWTAQWGLSFVVFGRILDYDEMNANDFIVNLPLEFRRGKLAVRFTLGHESAHLGDEFIARTGEEDIKFSREFIQALASVEATKRLRIYGGYTRALSTDSGRDVQEIQAGFELRSGGFQLLMTHDCWFYIAHDFQLKKELAWHGNNNSQVGIAVKFKEKRSRIRLFFNYFKGLSNFGQFFSEREETLSLGVAFDR